ncbi:PH domain-containing protein [Lachnoclostridium sp. Marseille-P6806]|uniref:PH domain-containing protein n=1 Tax=Lachnoclostridium sp. Marseille-P6806 TaxID=2364793 RepID=UPI0010316D02|nr:PH domain-containing protein [Lachnoclostridium sp. Marseille-P6806]
MRHQGAIWHDRKRNFLGLPWTFTVYELDRDRLFIDTGFLNSREDEVRLYRITDVSLTRSLWQRIIGTGTIHCDSSDHTLKNFDILNIKNSMEIKEKLSGMVEQARRENRVYTREDMRDYSREDAGEDDVPGDFDGDGIPDDRE